MTVRELITELLDFEIDAEVEVELNLNNESEFESFSVIETGGQVYLTVESLGSVIVDATRFEELEEAEQELEELKESEES